MTIVVTGASVLVPGDAGLAALSTMDVRPAGPVDPRSRVPGGGLRYKDRATQLGLAAANVALTDAGLLGGDGLTVATEAVAVVVSSNFGNVDTVCRVVRTIADGSAAAVSPMDLPNASSNVIASSVAIRYGLRGPNLMVCNGATSGLDAVHWAARLLRSGRARHALVLGVEPDNDVVRRLTGAEVVLDGAAAVILESAATARARDAVPRLELGAFARGAGVRDCLDRLARTGQAPPQAWFVPEPAGSPALAADLLAGVPRYDLTRTWGSASGALGLLQCVAAVGHFDAGATGPAYALNGTDTDDATAGLVLAAPAGGTR